MSNDLLTDDEIVALLFDRNEKALSALAYRYGAKLLRIAEHILGDRADGEECVNDVYLRVWESIPPTRPQVLAAYLTRLTRNAAIDLNKKRTSDKRIPSSYTIAIDELSNALSFSEAPENEWAEDVLAEKINAFVKGLSKERRYIFTARFYIGEPIETIAKTLSVHKATVYRELERMKKALDEFLH